MTSPHSNFLSKLSQKEISPALLAKYQGLITKALSQQLTRNVAKNDGARITELNLASRFTYNSANNEFTLEILDPKDLLKLFIDIPMDKRGMVPFDSEEGFTSIPSYKFKANKLHSVINQLNAILDKEFQVQHQEYTDVSKIDTLAKYNSALFSKFNEDAREVSLAEHEKNMAQAIGDTILDTIKEKETREDVSVSDLVFDLKYDEETKDYVLSVLDPDSLLSTYFKAPPAQKTFRHEQELVDYFDQNQDSEEPRPAQHHLYRAKTLEDLIGGLNEVLDEKHRIPSDAISR